MSNEESLGNHTITMKSLMQMIGFLAVIGKAVVPSTHNTSFHRVTIDQGKQIFMGGSRGGGGTRSGPPWKITKI